MSEMSLGKMLSQLREGKGLTQRQVGKQIGVSGKTISTYEHDIREPAINILQKLCGVYHVSMDYITGMDKKRRIDVSNLTREQAELIEQLVDLIAALNGRQR